MFADTFHKTLAEAMAEAARRRASPEGTGFLTNVDRSPYGGYRVRSIPAELVVDQLIEGPFAGNAFRRRSSKLGA